MNLGIKEKQTVALNSVIAAVFLTLIKLITGILTRSLGILSEAIHSGLDLGAAFITYIAIRISGKPPDKTHHYGHGKIESLAAFTETLLLLFTCLWIIVVAVKRIFTGRVEIKASEIGLIIMVISIAINIWRYLVLDKVSKKYNSQALKADALHFASDVATSIVVIIGLIFDRLGFVYADPIAALIASGIIIITCKKLLGETINTLTDEVPFEIEEKIKEKIKEIKNITGFHQLRIRQMGNYMFADFHVTVDEEIPFIEVHEITKKIEKEINKLGLGYSIDVTIHAEPSVPKKEKEEYKKGIVKKVMEKYKGYFVNFHNLVLHKSSLGEEVDMHLVLPQDMEVEKAHEICDLLEKDIKEKLPDVKINIHVEPYDKI